MRAIFVLALLCPLGLLGQPAARGNITRKEGNAMLTARPLIIGDTLPVVLLQESNTGRTLNTAFTSGKAIVLDFFASWCGACIKALPKLDSLQQQFGSQLQIVLVTYEPLPTFKNLQRKNRWVAATRLPVITSDTLLHQRFPHRILPHTVWINPHGIVSAITETHHLTAANLQQLVRSKPLSLPLKQDEISFDRSRPLLSGGNGGPEEALLWRSLLTPRLPGIASGNTRVYSPDSALVRYAFFNQSLLSLYAMATGHPYSNRWILQVCDTSRFLNPGLPLDTWESKNLYSYELTLPGTTTLLQFRNWMKEDLDRYFRLTTGWQKRVLPCLVLVRTSTNTNALRSRGGTPVNTLSYPDSTVKKLVNRPVAELVKALNLQPPDAPARPIVVDESGIDFNIDIAFNLPDLNNPGTLRKTLQGYGLDLVPASRLLEVFILSDKQHNH